MTSRVRYNRFRLFLELLEDRALPGYALSGLPPATAAPTTGTRSSLSTLRAGVMEGLPEASSSMDVALMPVFQESLLESAGAAADRGKTYVRGADSTPFEESHSPARARSAAESLGHSAVVTGQESAPPAPGSGAVGRLEAGAAPLSVSFGGAAGWNQALAEAVTAPPGGPVVTGSFELAGPFADAFTASDLGPVPGLPENYGGFTLAAGDANTLLIAGESDTSSAAVYAVGLVRDGDGHITGFDGTAVRGIETPHLSGNLAYGPENVFFYPRWPLNEVGQVLPGSPITNKVVAMAPLGVAQSVSGLNFVPRGLPGEGGLKLLSWSGGQFYNADYSPDGTGTYDITSAQLRATLQGGPSGFTYLYPIYPEISVPSMLVAEWSARSMAVYELDAAGNPRVSTRREFLTGSAGFHAPWFDPFTGDILIATYGFDDHVIAVRPRHDVWVSLRPRATYLFNDNLDPQQPATPALVALDPLGLNRFETAQVYGQMRRVYRYDGNNANNAGLRLDTTGLVAPNVYSVELIFQFLEEPGGYRRIMDVQDRQSDYGFYVDPFNRLRVYPEKESGATDFQLNRFHHVVLTNTGGGSGSRVRVYLDGLLELEVTNTTVMNINNPGNWLGLFADDMQVPGEYSDGRIALFRVYSGVLSDVDALLLSTDPFLYR